MHTSTNEFRAVMPLGGKPLCSPKRERDFLRVAFTRISNVSRTLGDPGGNAAIARFVAMVRRSEALLAFNDRLKIYKLIADYPE